MVMSDVVSLYSVMVDQSHVFLVGDDDSLTILFFKGVSFNRLFCL